MHDMSDQELAQHGLARVLDAKSEQADRKIVDGDTGKVYDTAEELFEDWKKTRQEQGPKSPQALAMLAALVAHDDRPVEGPGLIPQHRLLASRKALAIDRKARDAGNAIRQRRIEAERKQRQEEARRAHEAERQKIERERQAAHGADTHLSIACDRVEYYASALEKTKRASVIIEDADEVVAACRETVDRLRQELGMAEANLAYAEAEANDARTLCDVEAAKTYLAAEVANGQTVAAQADQAWLAVGSAYRKKHRDRAIRKRAMDLGLTSRLE